jgi:hypothetical protein
LGLIREVSQQRDLARADLTRIGIGQRSVRARDERNQLVWVGAIEASGDCAQSRRDAADVPMVFSIVHQSPAIARGRRDGPPRGASRTCRASWWRKT